MADISEWFSKHGKIVNVTRKKDPSDVAGVRELITYEAEDGATITIRQGEQPRGGGQSTPDVIVAQQDKPDPKDKKARVEADEAEANARPVSEGGTGRYETNAERDARLAREQAAVRGDKAETRAEGADARADQAAREASQERERQRGKEVVDVSYEGEGQNRRKVFTHRDNTKTYEAAPESRVQTGTEYKPDGTKVTHWNYGPDTTEAPNPDDVQRRNKPEFLSRADDTNPNIAMFNPQTGKIETTPNPNYDQAKAEAEKERQRISTEIAQRRMSLDEGIQQYTQWFNENVKVPFMQAEEERARAKEQREALDAEERRRQFASQFKLQKAELGEKAGEAAANQEIALLPYRAGPEEAQHMSDAINGLAAGGTPGGPSAGAGIHFSGADFQFARPDFKAIAAAATQQAIGHLTDYKPSGQSYGVGNYSGVTLPNAATMASAPSAVGAYQPPAPQIPVDSDQP